MRRTLRNSFLVTTAAAALVTGITIASAQGPGGGGSIGGGSSGGAERHQGPSGGSAGGGGGGERHQGPSGGGRVDVEHETRSIERQRGATRASAVASAMNDSAPPEKSAMSAPVAPSAMSVSAQPVRIGGAVLRESGEAWNFPRSNAPAFTTCSCVTGIGSIDSG